MPPKLKKYAAGEIPKVLVLDANQRSALAIIRSLGRHGLKVVAGDHEASPIGAASRYAADFVRYPNPAASPGSFVSEIFSTARRLAIDTIVPATDLTTMLLVRQPELSKIARVAAASPASYEALTDKARLIDLASSLDIPVPVTHVAGTAAEIPAAARDLGFPVVLKPARSRYLKGERIASTSVQIIRAPAHLAEVLRREDWLQDIPCLVQRYVAGHGAGIFTIYGPSGPVAWFAHRRIREKPPSGGVSVLSESAPIHPAMKSYATQLLSAAGWTGVAMVEFRVATDGTPYLMEVNGRFWGSLQLAIDCGVDFPWLFYQILHGSPVGDAPPYAVGKRLRWLLGDLDSLIISLRERPSTLGRRARALAAFLSSFADLSCRQEILRIRDARPGFRESANWLKSVRQSRSSR